MVGLLEVFNLASLLEKIEKGIFVVQTHFNGVLLTALFYDSEAGSDIRKVKKNYYNRVSSEISNLNSLVSFLNKYLNKNFKHLRTEKLIKIDLKAVEKIINEHKDNSHLGRRYTHLKLNNTLLPLINSKVYFPKRFNDLFSIFGGENVKFNSAKVGKNIEEAFDVYSIGYLGTSVFIIGKTLEMVITNYLKKLKKVNKINYKTSEINKWNFDTKLNILKKDGFLTQPQFSKMMSLKWDRNTFGHPSKFTETKQAMDDADAMIRIGVNSIKVIERKITSIKN